MRSLPRKALYQGYPVGYLIAWRNPTVKLKDGTPSAGKRVLIDGQQRVTALMAGLLGREVLTKDSETIRIRIAFHPQLEKFEVANPAIRKDVEWIEDVASVFAPDRASGWSRRDDPERDRPVRARLGVPPFLSADSAGEAREEKRDNPSTASRSGQSDGVNRRNRSTRS